MSGESIPLWCDLSRAEHFRHLSRFMHLAPTAISLLGISEFSLLMQWIFEQSDLETKGVDEEDGRIDLALVNRQHRWDEFARIYFKGTGVPTNALWDLLKKLEGTPVKKIHLCTVGTFSKAQKRLQSEFPLALAMVEGDGLQRHLCEAQRTWQRKAAPRKLVRSAIRTRREKGLWTAIKQRLLAWLQIG